VDAPGAPSLPGCRPATAGRVEKDRDSVDKALPVWTCGDEFGARGVDEARQNAAWCAPPGRPPVPRPHGLAIGDPSRRWAVHRSTTLVHPIPPHRRARASTPSTC